MQVLYLKNDGLDKSINGWCKRECRALEVPEDDPTLREDREQVQHLLTLLNL